MLKKYSVLIPISNAIAAMRWLCINIDDYCYSWDIEGLSVNIDSVTDRHIDDHFMYLLMQIVFHKKNVNSIDDSNLPITVNFTNSDTGRIASCASCVLPLLDFVFSLSTFS